MDKSIEKEWWGRKESSLEAIQQQKMKEVSLKFQKLL